MKRHLRAAEPCFLQDDVVPGSMVIGPLWDSPCRLLPKARPVAAALSLLAKEPTGAKKQIKVNVVAPYAASRMSQLGLPFVSLQQSI